VLDFGKFLGISMSRITKFAYMHMGLLFCGACFPFYGVILTKVRIQLIVKIQIFFPEKIIIFCFSGVIPLPLSFLAFARTDSVVGGVSWGGYLKVSIDPLNFFHTHSQYTMSHNKMYWDFVSEYKFIQLITYKTRRKNM
jgi:hypothetical protein